MKQVELKSRNIRGKVIRTNNHKIEEIIGLWQQVPSMSLKGTMYAVYYHYKSDHHGDYDFLIGNEGYQFDETVTLSEGNYLKIEVLEATPEKVGKAWQKIWQDSNIYEKRLFTTDFEEYLSTGQVNIYLAIQ